MKGKPKLVKKGGLAFCAVVLLCLTIGIASRNPLMALVCGAVAFSVFAFIKWIPPLSDTARVLCTLGVLGVCTAAFIIGATFGLGRLISELSTRTIFELVTLFLWLGALASFIFCILLFRKDGSGSR